MKEITLLVADDHPLFRQGVVEALSLESDFQVCCPSRRRKWSHYTHPIIKSNGRCDWILTCRVWMGSRWHIRLLLNICQRVLFCLRKGSQQAIHAVLAGAVGYCAKEINPMFSPELFERWLKANMLLATSSIAVIWTAGSMNKWMACADRIVSPARLSPPFRSRDGSIILCGPRDEQ